MYVAEPYGLPSFAYHGMVISWFWRYSCPQYPCFSGGFVSSALGFSYNSKNWTAFGQFPFPRSHGDGHHNSDVSDGSPSSRSSDSPHQLPLAVAGPVVVRGPLNNTDIGSAAYHHTYTVFPNKTAGALSCQAECDSDAKCFAWTCVLPPHHLPSAVCCATYLTSAIPNCF